MLKLGPTGRTANVCTGRAFGDVELYLEFMLARIRTQGFIFRSA